VNLRGPLPSIADPRRDMPEAAAAREDAADAALWVLAAETSRLERLGLSAAAGRCREARRYWSFMRALVAVAGDPAPPRRGRLA
jgi:hypothetical protein